MAIVYSQTRPPVLQPPQVIRKPPSSYPSSQQAMQQPPLSSDVEMSDTFSPSRQSVQSQVSSSPVQSEEDSPPPSTPDLSSDAYQKESEAVSPSEETPSPKRDSSSASPPPREVSPTIEDLKAQVASGVQTSRVAPSGMDHLRLPSVKELKDGISDEFSELPQQALSGVKASLSSAGLVLKNASKGAAVGGVIGAAVPMAIFWKKKDWFWGTAILGSLVGAGVGATINTIKHAFQSAKNFIQENYKISKA